MKNLIYPLVFTLTAFFFVYSCSTDEDDAPPPAAIVKKYTLAVTAGEGGTVSSSGGTYSQGTQVSITATPSSGYTFTGWSNGTTDNPISITLNSDQNLTANFTKRSYPLSINIIGEGTVTEEVINTGKTTDYEHGTTVRLTAVPNEGWGVTKWKGAIESKSVTIDIVVNEEKEVTVEFHERYVPVYRGLTYDYPNNTSSKAIQQNFKQPKNLKDSVIIKGLIGLGDLDSSFPIGDGQYTSWSPGIEFDYNNDGNIDYFTFLTSNPPGKWAIEDGIYLLIIDAYNPNREYKYFPSNGHKFEFIPELIDINNDGIFEIIAGNHSSHVNGEGLHGNSIPPRIYYFDDNGNMFFEEFINEPRGTHDFALGDVDNDGDMDVLYWEYTPIGVGSNITQELWNKEFYGKPILYINNGINGFDQIDRKISFPGLYTKYIQKDQFEWDQYPGLFVELFDFDEDGNLDIIIGDTYVQNENDTKGLKIFWGNGKGVFNFNNGYDLPNNSVNDYNLSETYIPHGGCYLDIDNDGDLDIIVMGSPDYSSKTGWWIQIFEQTSKKVFKDVSKERLGNVSPVSLFQNTFWDENGQNIDPIFFEKGWYLPTKAPFVIDIDNDGDYDILPFGPQINPDFGATDNFYYENMDGIFYERWYNDPEE